MILRKIAAFAHENKGGNPAGVAICEEMPPEKEMLGIAKQLGYSETAFLHALDNGWRVRYFSPEIEIPFCGHATIASGAALGEHSGEGVYRLFLNTDEISVEVKKSENGQFKAALQSPKTWSKPAPKDSVAKVLGLFGLEPDNLDIRFPAYYAFAGAKHLILVLKDRKKLVEMDYDFEKTKNLMLKEDIATISLLWAESDAMFHSRNAFAAGGVYEDPATGAAAAALAGYLRDIGWQGKKRFIVTQGEDMGYPSRLVVEFTAEPGASIKISGETRDIDESRSVT